MTDEGTEPHDSRPGSAGGLAPARHVGEVLGETYRITRKIGAGGMADVYEVEHLRLGGRFAVKVARSGGPDAASLRRFIKEAKLLASLTSDHIVKVFDVSRPGDSVPYYVMELLEGRDLHQLIRHARELSVARAVSIVLDACRGVSVMHSAGLVHRDLKPENLFVTNRDGGGELCKLLDFGVVRGEEGNSTQHGALIGTVKYMAPEQIESSGTVSPRSDVYSLGAILYECLAGRPPHVADTLERLLYAILNQAPVPLRTLRPELPDALDALVMCALEREPAARFPGVHELSDALRPFASESLDHDDTIPPGALRSSPGRNRASRVAGPRLGTALLSLIGVIAVSGLVLGVLPSAPEKSAPHAARAVPAARQPVRDDRTAIHEPQRDAPPARSAQTAAASPPPVASAELRVSEKRSLRSRGGPAGEPRPAEEPRFGGPLIEEANPYGP